MWAPYLTIQDVNNLESDRFIKIFGNVVERCLAAGIGILKNRPFESIDDISHAIEAYLDGLKTADKVNILQMYPDSVSQLAGFSSSTLEFNTAHRRIIANGGAPSLRFEQKKRLKQLAKSYKEKNGFPFIVSSKNDNVEELCAQIELRLLNSKREEIENALKEVKKMCRLRIHEIIK